MLFHSSNDRPMARKASNKYADEPAMQIMLAHYECLVFAALPRKDILNSHFRSMVERFRA